MVAVTGASNLLGTIPDHAAIAERVHAVGALLWVDAVHLAAHVRIDRAALGADVRGLLAVQVLRSASRGAGR